jgi:hypothetical protein
MNIIPTITAERKNLIGTTKKFIHGTSTCAAIPIPWQQIAMLSPSISQKGN